VAPPALNDAADPETILAAIRAGANEFLYPPLDAGLNKALERISADRVKQQAASRQRGKTLGFLSAKGGCGATTIACHVAVELQKSTSKEVLLADMDLDTGMVGFLMKAKTPYTILDAVRNVHRLDLSYWKALVSNGHAHLEVITAPPAASVHEALDPQHFRHVLQFLRSTYDWVVVDLGRSLNSLALGVVDDIDELYLVSTLDMPALHLSKQVVQALFDAGYSKNRLHLVMNRMPKRSDITSGELQRVLGVPIFEALPNDYPLLYEAYAEGNLLNGSSELGKSLGALAMKIAGVKAKEKPKQKLNLSIF
jgi:pilus assembly protein CpaE